MGSSIVYANHQPWSVSGIIEPDGSPFNGNAGVVLENGIGWDDFQPESLEFGHICKRPCTLSLRKFFNRCNFLQGVSKLWNGLEFLLFMHFSVM
jgi:hypothetical protein